MFSSCTENSIYSGNSSSPLLATGRSIEIGGISQVCQTPEVISSIHDSISAHIPLKIKEKIWRGEYIHFGLLLKSAKELATDSYLDGDFVLKGGALTIVNKKPNSVNNIHSWTTAFMIFMDIMLEKWPFKAREYLKYMQSIRIAASRGCNNGWVAYDEQYRIKKTRLPFSSWALIDQELWVLYIVTNSAGHQTDEFGISNSRSPTSYSYNSTLDNQNRPHFRNGISNYGQNFDNSFRARVAVQRFRQKCFRFNEERCTFGKKCKFEHRCTKCSGPHPVTKCRN